MRGVVILVVFLIIFFVCYFNREEFAIESRVDGYEENDVFCEGQNGPCYKGKQQVRCIQSPRDEFEMF